MTCLFCGFGVDVAAARRACDACSFGGGAGCRSVCCPRCGYATPDEPPLLARLRGWLGGRVAPRDGIVSLAAMAVGDRGTVMKIDGADAGHARKLMALGVVPGAAVELERRSPAVVFRTGFTQLAVDEALAASIVVSLDG